MKVAIITGHRWAGKTTLCSTWRDKGAHWMCLDPIYNAVAEMSRSAGTPIMKADKNVVFDVFRSAFRIALPEQAPACFVSDGMMYGDDPTITLALASALLTYNRPLDLRFYNLIVSKDELERRFRKVRASIIESEGQNGVELHDLKEFMFRPLSYVGYFTPVSDSSVVHDFLFPAENERLRAQ
jgi:hypothetical protein